VTGRRLRGEKKASPMGAADGFPALKYSIVFIITKLVLGSLT
jgi:hypothetical protein